MIHNSKKSHRYDTNTEDLGGVNSTDYLLQMVDAALNNNYNTSIDILGGRYSDDYNATLIDIGLEVTKNTSVSELNGRYSALYVGVMMFANLAILVILKLDLTYSKTKLQIQRNDGNTVHRIRNLCRGSVMPFGLFHESTSICETIYE